MRRDVIPNDATPSALMGKRVLVIEDEMILAFDIEALLEEQGCDVEAVGSIPRALDALRNRPPDLATLDMNLNGDASAPLAAALRDAGTPFLVITGYSDAIRTDSASRDAPLLKKPFDGKELVRTLTGLIT